MALSISQWAEMSWWGTFVRESTMGFAIASVFLLFGIVLLLGGVFLVSLRLLGWVMADNPVPQVAADFRRWTLIGMAATLIAGPTMWAATAMRYYDSGPFWLEMQLLVVAIVFHFTWFHYVTTRSSVHPALRRVTGLVAVVLWFGVGVAGRAIGFF
jgi:hypothetical protein